jgi:hypothetical protein
MEKLKEIINNHQFSNDTLDRVLSKGTLHGALTELSTARTFKEMYPTHEAVFTKIFETMRLKAGDMCLCGYRISKCWERIYDHKRNCLKMQYRCKMCDKGKNVYSPLALTPLKGVHKPLDQILEIAFKLINDKRGVSATQISRDYGWKYDASLHILRRIRIWMGISVGFFKFEDNIVECDETYISIPTGLGRNIVRTRGIGSERKQPVFGIVERNGRKARAWVLDDANRANIQPKIQQTVSTSVPVFTDGSPIYKYLSSAGYVHEECNHSQKKWAVDHVNTNKIESFNALLKGQMGVTHKGVSKEHLQKYLDEACFRFAHPYAFEGIEALFNILPPLNIKRKIVPNVNLN